MLALYILIGLITLIILLFAYFGVFHIIKIKNIACNPTTLLYIQY